MKNDAPAFHLPTRPYSPIDALNRQAAALGSPRYAMATSYANYNGHHVTLSWNDYRQYYVAEYYWAERVVIGRGSFESCLRAVIEEYDRGALGASASIYPRADDTDAIALCHGNERLRPGSAFDKGSEVNAGDTWYTWRHAVAARCARDVANPRMLVVRFDWELMQATGSEDEYMEALKERYGRAYC